MKSEDRVRIQYRIDAIEEARRFINAVAKNVTITDDTLMVDLTDGRTIRVPLVWYPRLYHGTSAERNKWELIDGGRGIHWPDLDEHISVKGLLIGRPSAENPRSLQKWLDEHAQQ